MIDPTSDKHCFLGQSFATLVPLRTRVPQRGVRGAAKFGITAFLMIFYCIRCSRIVILNQLRVPPIFLNLKGADNQKRLKNIDLG